MIIGIFVYITLLYIVSQFSKRIKTVVKLDNISRN